MGLGELAKRGKAEIVMGRWIGHYGGSATGLAMPPIDPHRGNSHSVCRHVVVKEALRDVKEFPFADTLIPRAGQKILEIAQVRFVRTDVLSGQYMIELDT